MPPTLLDKILAPGAISTVFQAIYKAEPAGLKPVILECLSRGPASTNAAHAGVLFEYSQLKAAEPLIDRACVTAALSTVAMLNRPEKFSLNVFAATLVRDAGFVRWIAGQMKQLQLDPSRVIFELVEHGEAWDMQAFLSSLCEIRALGSSVALDDVGLAHSNFQRILDCNPEFLKLDRCIVRNCDRDGRRQALLRSLGLLAKDLGSSLIAEGVETYEEMNTVRSHDISLFQGFLFSRPVSVAEVSRVLDAPALRRPPMPVPALEQNRRRAILTRSHERL